MTLPRHPSEDEWITGVPKLRNPFTDHGYKVSAQPCEKTKMPQKYARPAKAFGDGNNIKGLKEAGITRWEAPS